MVSNKFLTPTVLALLLTSSVALGAATDGFIGSQPAFDKAAPDGAKINVGDYGVSEATGSATYSYDVAVPPGRRGIQPSVSMR